jgi:hypothetical protein
VSDPARPNLDPLSRRFDSVGLATLGVKTSTINVSGAVMFVVFFLPLQLPLPERVLPSLDKGNCPVTSDRAQDRAALGFVLVIASGSGDYSFQVRTERAAG